MYSSLTSDALDMSRKYDDTSSFLPETDVKGHLASLLNDALLRIKMLEQQLQLEKMKNGTFVLPAHKSPGRETYISPRQYEDAFHHHVSPSNHHRNNSPQSEYSTSSRSNNNNNNNKKKKQLLGPFSPKGGEFMHSLKNMAWAEEFQKGQAEYGNAGVDMGMDDNGQNSSTFSLAEAKNLQQTAARNKRTCDQLRESLASVQHEKTKFEMQHNHIKGKLVASNEKNLKLEHRILELKDRMQSEIDRSKDQIKTLSENSSALDIQMERNKELEAMVQELKRNNSAQNFVMNSRKSHITKLKQSLNDEANQRQALSTRINELTQEKRRLEGANHSHVEKINQTQQELEIVRKELLTKVDEFNAMRGDKLKADDDLHQLKIDLESRQTHLVEAEEKISFLKEKLLRLEANMDNIEKNSRNEKSELSSSKDALQNELKEVTRAYKDVKEKSRIEKEESARGKQKIQDLQNRCNSLNADIASLKEELRQVKDEKHRVELRAQSDADEGHALREQVQGLQVDLQREQERVESLRQEHSRAVGNISDAKSQSNMDRENIRRLEAQLKSKTSALEKERNDSAKLRKVKMDLEISVDRERREKDVAKERATMLDQRIEQMDKDYEDSMGKLHQMNRNMENSQMEIQSIHDQKQQISRECDGLKDEIDRLKNLLSDAESNLDRVENEKRKDLQEAEERYKVLERALENLRKNISSNSNSPSRRRGAGRRQSQIQIAAANAAATSDKVGNSYMEAGEQDEDLRLRSMFNKGNKGSQKSPMMIKFEKESILRALSNASTFKDIPKAALQEMINQSNVYTFNIGDFVIKQGEMGSRMYIIANGKVRITRNTFKIVDGEEVEIEQHLINRTLGQFFGEFAMIADAVRTANVIADSSPMKCLGVDRTAYEALNRQFNNVFSNVVAPHKVGANQKTVHIPQNRVRSYSKVPYDRSRGSSYSWGSSNSSGRNSGLGANLGI